MKTKYLPPAFFMATTALMVATYFDREMMILCSRTGAFYCILALFFCWITTICLFLLKNKFDARIFVKQHLSGLLSSLLLASIVFVSAKPYFRVLSDETNLLSVSKSMLYNKNVYNVVEGHWNGYNFEPVSKTTVNEKRPYLFPFLTYVIHTLIGYSAASPFIVNFILYFILLAGVFIFVRGSLGPMYAYSAILLVSAQPVIAQNAASAGIDNIMVVFIFLSFISLTVFLKDPGRDKFQLLWVNLLMLANTRYEGAIFLVITAAMLLMFKQLKADYLDSYPVYLTPLLMLPVFWQRFCRYTYQENPLGVSVFSFSNFISHSKSFFKTLYTFDFYYPYASIINILGVIAAVYFLYLLLKNKWPSEQPLKQAAWISLACLAGHWIVVNSYFFGGATINPVSARFFAFHSMVLSLLCVMFIERAVFFKEKEKIAVIFSSIMFLLYNPVTVQNRFSNSLCLPGTYQFEMEFFQRQGTGNIMILTAYPYLFSARNYGAIYFDTIRQAPGAFLDTLSRHTYEHVYAIQNIRFDTNKPDAATELPPVYALRTVYEIQYDTSTFTRISEVTPLQENKPAAAPSLIYPRQIQPGTDSINNINEMDTRQKHSGMAKP